MNDACPACGAERAPLDIFADEVTDKVLDIVEALIKQHAGVTEGPVTLPQDWCAAMLDGLMQGVVDATFSVANDAKTNRPEITAFLRESLELCIESTLDEGEGATVQ